MNKLDKLIKILLDEIEEKIDVPTNESEKFYLYKTLVNIRLPKEIDEKYLLLEDEFLQSRLKDNIIDINNPDVTIPSIPNIFPKLEKGTYFTLAGFLLNFIANMLKMNIGIINPNIPNMNDNIG